MTAEMHQRRIISRSYVKIFVPSDMARHDYPYRLQKPGYASERIRNLSLEYILDSGIGDDVTNEEVLDLAHELDATYVVAKDYLHDRDATVDSVLEFMELYDDHPCTSKPMIPLQPPHDRHYRALEGFTHYMVGGVMSDSPKDQINAVRTLRSECGPQKHIHLLGAGMSSHIVRAVRDDPGLLDSLDVSTPERLPIVGKVCDESLERIDYTVPCGQESSTIRAAVANNQLLLLNYMMGPLWDGYDDTEQSQLPGVGA